jgi:riboflavin kinase/FMN adenylyltransferase
VLKAFSKDFGFVVEEISAEDIDRIAISSTKIRKAIEEGNVELAAEFLGHHFFLSGIVIEGKQLGRTLGFATANLKIESQDKIIPKTGVYFVSVIVDGQQYFGMANIGINPTTDNEASLKIEVHIFEFAANIYSKTIKLNFLKRLRDEKKFGNLTELKIALHNDQKLCLDLISEKK